MAQTYKRLGAISPTANTQTNVYVVPSSTEAVISTITVCNQDLTNARYSLIVMPPGDYSASAATKDYIIRDSVVPALDTIILTIGLTANAQTVLASNTSGGNVSFSAFGSEIT